MADIIFVIGGQNYPVPVMNFKALRKVWPYVENVRDTEDMTDALAALPAIVEAALARTDNPLTADQIEDQLLAPEMQALQEQVTELMVQSGVLKRVTPGDDASGEAEGEAAPPSTETGTDTSQSLLPLDAPVETGTK